MMKKISMFLMNQKGFYVLSEFIKNYPADIIGSIVSSTDSAVEKDYNDEIKALCSLHNIPYYDRTSHLHISHDYCFAVGWRWIISSAENLIVFHDSLLPKYRGFNPLVSCLINHEKKIGVTALFASDNYDAGEIIMQRETSIDYPIKINQAIDKICLLYFDLIKSITDSILHDKPLVAYRQNETEISYSLWRDEFDYKIDWNQEAASIKRFIDAVGYPYKGAYAFMGDEKIKIFDAEVLPDVNIENRTPGKVIFVEEGNPIVVCAKGLLKLTAMTDEMKKTILPLERFRVRFA